MSLSRVLDPVPVESLDQYLSDGGGVALAGARQAHPDDLMTVLDESGLRGRGGAGFPTGTKWRTVAEHRSNDFSTTVVVNAAEGEPGSFKDRQLIRTNPYRVLEGALVAAMAMEAEEVVVAVKKSFTTEVARLRAAIAEMSEHGWMDRARIEVFEGPSHYLYGEETGLLEALNGRPPFPRVTPPWRRGIVEIELDDDDADADGAVADLELATEGAASPVPPALVNNAETLAHVATIIANGSGWFRAMGTDESPGSLLCTVSGSTRRHGVAEVECGTPLSTVLADVGGGPGDDREFRAALSGVANPLLTAEHLDTPLTYEAMRAVGNGLGAAGFIVFDDRDDLVDVIAAASRFLAVESCGQCRPCKADGLAMAELLRIATETELSEHEWDELRSRRESVITGARCNLAQQQQLITGQAHALASRPRPVDGRPIEIAPIADIVDGVATLDPDQSHKQPDWSLGGDDSGQYPAESMVTTT